MERTVVNTVPHDLGDPEEEPWIMVSFPAHTTSVVDPVGFKTFSFIRNSKFRSRILLNHSGSTTLLKTVNSWGHF